MSAPKSSPVDDGLYLQIERFLFWEARLLDRRDYGAWFSLATEDIRYSVTVAVMRNAEAKAVEYSIIEEDWTALKSRVDQISNPRLTRAENPPSLTRRVVSNVEAYEGGVAGEIAVISNLLVYRSRSETPEGGFYVAEREDVLRRGNSNWRLARRTVRLDQNMLIGGTLSVLL